MAGVQVGGGSSWHHSETNIEHEHGGLGWGRGKRRLLQTEHELNDGKAGLIFAEEIEESRTLHPSIYISWCFHSVLDSSSPRSSLLYTFPALLGS